MGNLRSFLREKEKQINMSFQKHAKQVSSGGEKEFSKDLHRYINLITAKANYTQMSNAREIAIRHYISNIDEDVTLEEIEEILANRGDFTQLNLFQDYEHFDLETVVHEIDSLAKLIISYA